MPNDRSSDKTAEQILDDLREVVRSVTRDDAPVIVLGGGRDALLRLAARIGRTDGPPDPADLPLVLSEFLPRGMVRVLPREMIGPDHLHYLPALQLPLLDPREQPHRENFARVNPWAGSLPPQWLPRMERCIVARPSVVDEKPGNFDGLMHEFARRVADAADLPIEQLLAPMPPGLTRYADRLRRMHGSMRPCRCDRCRARRRHRQAHRKRLR